MSDKFEISVCYRKVFELLNKVSSVQDLINRIAEFAEIEIIITDIAGKILAVSNENCQQDQETIEQIAMNYYEEFKGTSETKAFETDDQRAGAVGIFSVKGNEEGFAVTFAEQEYVSQLNDIVCQAVGIVEERFGRKIHCHASTERRMAAKALFENQELAKVHVTEPFVAAIVQAEISDSEHMHKLENEIIDMYEKSFVYTRKDQMYILFEDVHREDIEVSIHKKLEVFCGKNELRCVISERFDNIELLSKRRFSLSETLHIAPKEKQINKEYDFYLEMICSCAVDKIGHARYMEGKLQKMWEDDRTKGTEFYRSLKEYLLLRNNVSMTAKRLFIHRNTMLYRLSKVSEILGVDINDPVIANNLLISMILQEIERRNS